MKDNAASPVAEGLLVPKIIDVLSFRNDKSYYPHDIFLPSCTRILAHSAKNRPQKMQETRTGCIVCTGGKGYAIRKQKTKRIPKGTMIDIKTYGLIRRMALDGKTIRSIARELDIARSTVAKYYDGSCIPTAEHRKERTRKRQVVTEDVDSFILECLEEDEREGERKQRHTAHRIFKRLRDEKGFQGAESTIRARCRKLKDARRIPKADIPLLYDPGEAVQVDFGQAKAYVNGEKIKIHYFCARLCYSCAIYVYCGLSENTETFLEGLRNSFEFFHGVPRRVIFDNGGVAVSEGSGKKAVATEKYEAMSAHYGFETVFCNRAAGNEKGLV